MQGTSSINHCVSVHGFIPHKTGTFTIKCVTNITGNEGVCVVVVCGSSFLNLVELSALNINFSYIEIFSS